jgi:hypothetical protein
LTARLIAARFCEAGGRHEDALRHLITAAGISHMADPTLAEKVIVMLVHAERGLPKADVARLFEEYDATRLQAKRKTRTGQ